MFLTDCTVCGLRELRGARAIELLANTEHGVEMVYRCRGCESTQLVDRGRHPQPAAATAA